MDRYTGKKTNAVGTGEVLLSDFDWVIGSEFLNELLMSGPLTVEELSSGMEATVYIIQLVKSDVALALKHWNKRAPGNALNQFYLLEKLHQIGLPVSLPFAMGRNNVGDYGLITSFDGMPLPLENIEATHMKTIANLLVKVHSTNVDPIANFIPKHAEFEKYFFSLTEEHSDIAKQLQVILRDVIMNTDSLIHGDYNLGNIVMNNGNHTIIDWTNAQLGDRRYDFAWASFLILIYNGEDCYKEFLHTYIQQIPTDAREIYIFEMIACLRWVWLSRIAPIPLHKETRSRVKRFIGNHKELQPITIGEGL